MVDLGRCGPSCGKGTQVRPFVQRCESRSFEQLISEPGLNFR